LGQVTTPEQNSGGKMSYGVCHVAVSEKGGGDISPEQKVYVEERERTKKSFEAPKGRGGAGSRLPVIIRS